VRGDRACGASKLSRVERARANSRQLPLLCDLLSGPALALTRCSDALGMHAAARTGFRRGRQPVLLFGGWPIIFKLDQLLELCDRRIGVFHRWERMPSGEDKTAHQIFANDDEPKPARSPLPRSGSVQQIAAGNAGWRSQFRFAVHAGCSRVPELWTLGR